MTWTPARRPRPCPRPRRYTRPYPRRHRAALALIATASLTLVGAPASAAIQRAVDPAGVPAVLPAVDLPVLDPPAVDPRSSDWRWPIDPPVRVVNGFDRPAHPWLPGHRGVDLRSRTFAPIRAAGAGVVSFAGPLAGRGVVVVEHRGIASGDLRTTYEPVEAVVAVGDVVERGQVIGRLQSHDWHCRDPCLHWGLRRGLDYLDPLLLVRQPAIRLLPHLSGGSSSGTDGGARGSRGPVSGVRTPEAQQDARRSRSGGGAGGLATVGTAAAAFLAGAIRLRRPSGK